MSRPNIQSPITITHYALLITYLALATLFAVTTPAWQNPDEPAHYNYIAHIARGDGLPYLQMGDYDQLYLEQLTSRKFPPDLSIEPVRYEFHQPPLYYLIAAPVFSLAGGSLIALRLFNALMGVAVIALIFLTVRAIFPARPRLALGTAAFVAFLPMHVAILSSVNNDPLAGVIVAATMYVLARWVREEFAGGKFARLPVQMQLKRNSQSALRLSQFATRNSPLLFLGLLIGLGFLTKATTYILLPVVVLTVFVVAWRRGGWRRAVLQVTAVSVWALLLGLPLWLRNIYLYGGFDFLGLAWHDLVVTGQPTTAGWIAANGWAAYWERALRFTFNSFWGVFGWMGVFMDGRIYTLLMLFSALIVFGLVAKMAQVRRRWAALDHAQRTQLGALALLLAGVGASYVWYNLGFVQHQGRYLFPGLLPIGLLVAVGWRSLLRPLTSVLAAIFLLAGVIVAVLMGWHPDRWTILFVGGGISGLLAYAVLTIRLRWWEQPPVWIEAVPFVLLVLLDMAIPFLYIGPQLRIYP
ncbi:MAG: glycosyltransferase family 39 protein [Caldilineaceae bacterium]